jgi:anhydro-N-acetylmuramic acid kinase
LRARIDALIRRGEAKLATLGAVDVAVGRFFADCALDLLRRAAVPAASVRAIGHHGQTICHEPNGPEAFTMQIGDPNSIAARTGITTVADFRRLDMAHGGQGAPLASGFHEWLLRDTAELRVVLNVGGIANVTILDRNRPAVGFDTGPGNTLLDDWIHKCRGEPFDDGGAWAQAGRVDEALLAQLLSEPFFAKPPPKSTGRELFNSDWLDACLGEAAREIAGVDVQATLAELTARTIGAALAAWTKSSIDRMIVCGGGARNADLLTRIGLACRCDVVTSDAYGVAPDWIEAAAFAWLARARLAAAPGNVPTVTGARRAAVLGGVYYGESLATRS